MRGKVGRRLARFMARDPIAVPPGRAAVCITFDDIPVTACTAGAQLLAQAGGRATYFASGGFDTDGSQDRFHTGDDLVRLHAEGHEIGCHGFGHLDYQSVPADAVSADLKKNQRYFEEIGVPPAQSFAYPYGCVNPAIKRICGDAYGLCRGIHPGINTDQADRRLLPAIPLYDATWSTGKSEQTLETVARTEGIVVFFTHGVEEAPGPFDCSPRLLSETLAIANRFDLPLLTMSAAFGRMTVPA
jgi:peptidoglycan/xylan/chitin deacetylase (PgdA/CDA1 family)